MPWRKISLFPLTFSATILTRKSRTISRRPLTLVPSSVHLVCKLVLSNKFCPWSLKPSVPLTPLAGLFLPQLSWFFMPTTLSFMAKLLLIKLWLPSLMAPLLLRQASLPLPAASLPSLLKSNALFPQPHLVQHLTLTSFGSQAIVLAATQKTISDGREMFSSAPTTTCPKSKPRQGIALQRFVPSASFESPGTTATLAIMALTETLPLLEPLSPGRRRGLLTSPTMT